MALLTQKIMSDGDVEIFNEVDVSCSNEGILFQSSEDKIKDLHAFFRFTGLSEMVLTFGWIFVRPIQFDPEASLSKILLIPKPGRFRLSTDDMRQMLILQLFLFQLKRFDFGQDPCKALCRFRMFGMWIWRGEIPVQSKLQPLITFCNKAQQILQKHSDIRLMCQGQIIAPGLPIRTYCDANESTMPILDICIEAGMSGGGPIDLKPAVTRQVQLSLQPEADENVTMNDAGPISVHTHDLKRMLQENRDSVLVRMFTQWSRMPEQLRDFPVDDFLDFGFKVDEGMLVFQGPLKPLGTFNKHLKASGVELVTFQAGWLFALQFIEFGDPPAAKLLCIPRPDQASLDPEALRTLLQMCFVSMAMPPKKIPSHTTCNIKINLWGAMVFHGDVSRNLMSSEIFDAYDRGSSLLDLTIPIRLISRGKMVVQEYPIRHYIHQDPKMTTVLHFVLSLHGGGGPKPTPTWEAKHMIATAMISAGAALGDIDKFADEFIRAAGPSSIMDTCKPASPTAKLANLKKLATKLKITIPDLNRQVNKINQKVKDKLRNAELALDIQELPKNLKVQEGFFTNQDGTACHQHALVQPNKSGFVLQSPEEAVPWLQTPHTLSQDEFGIVVVGSCLCENKHSCKPLAIPMCSSPDNPLLVRGTLHQLGGKEIKVDHSKNTEVPVSDTTVLCITAFRDEVGEAGWHELASSPIKFCLAQLQIGDRQLQLASPPWGRNFLKDKAKVEAQRATSFQFHCRIPSSDVTKALKASGFAGLYTTVKSEQKQVSQDYNVVWLTQSTVDLQKMMATYPEHRGIVRSSKAHASGRGLRFLQTDFADAWKKLRPNEAEPVLIARFMFKVSPTPIGAISLELQQFFKSIQWRAKPIRALASSTWLCGSEERRPESFLRWNGATLLVRWLNSKSMVDQVILAGNMPRQTKTVDNTMKHDQLNGANDAWAQYRATHGSVFANTSALPSMANGTTAPRKVDAPIEDRFRKQDQALETFKQQSSDTIAKLQNEVLQLQDTVQKTGSKVDANHKQIQSDFLSLRKETAAQFQTMQTSFQSSLDNSLQNHEKHVSSQFAEIKKLILDASRNEPRKTQKTEHDTSMDGIQKDIQVDNDL